ncbi:hypothetical protein [Streptomyces sp.]
MIVLNGGSSSGTSHIARVIATHVVG